MSLLITSPFDLSALEWSAIGICVVYLAPYIVASYYDRYGLPLIGVKVLLVIWGVERVIGIWTTRGRSEHAA